MTSNLKIWMRVTLKVASMSCRIEQPWQKNSRLSAHCNKKHPSCRYTIVQHTNIWQAPNVPAHDGMVWYSPELACHPACKPSDNSHTNVVCSMITAGCTSFLCSIISNMYSCAYSCTVLLQNAVSSTRLQLETEQQAQLAVQCELAAAEQKQASLQQALQQEQLQLQEQTRKVQIMPLAVQKTPCVDWRPPFVPMVL